MKRVLVFGTFDIIHPGHLYFLKQAKKYGDFLVVSIARDEVARRIKGRKPRHTAKERNKLLESLRIVDKVAVGAKNDYIAHIVKLKPDVIVLGYDQKAFTQKLKEKLAGRGLKKVRILRIKPYKPYLYKTRKLL